MTAVSRQAAESATPYLEFLLGLPYLRGPLLATARRLKAPVLVSANSFSRWRAVPPLTRMVAGREKTFPGYREWDGFKPPAAALVASMPVCLDSAGFVAMRRYRGFPWPLDAYLDLCAAAPWRWFASMDLCVEPEIAGNESAVLDRVSGTVRLNVRCMTGARHRGILDRLVPVIQGWEVRHYLRCLDRLSAHLDGFPLIGVGSMCRRSVEGQRGILQVVDALDRELPAGVRLHLFGLKSTGMEEIRGHPRIASVDSQAYGVRARHQALEGGHSKTEAFVAGVMEGWYADQVDRVRAGGFRFRAPCPLLPLSSPGNRHPVLAEVDACAEHLRELHEAGEIDDHHAAVAAFRCELECTDD